MAPLRSIAALTVLFVLAAPARAETPGEAVGRARALTGKQDYKGARDVLERALSASPRDPAANELLGFCFMKLYLFDEACEAFARGDEKDRYHDINFGFCLRKTGRLLEALERFKRAQAALGPQDSWTAYCQDQVAELAPLAKARAVLCLAQADDFVVASVTRTARARGGGEVAIPLDAFLAPGKNELRALAVNTMGPWSYRVRLYLGGKLAWSAGEGYAAKGLGAFENDETVGVVGEAAIEIEVAPGGALRLAAARSLVDFKAARAKMLEAEALWKDGRFPDAIRLFEAGAKEWPGLDHFHRRLAEACEEIALTLQDATTEAAGRRDRLRKAAAAARERWLEVRRKVATLAGDDAGAYQALAGAYASVQRHAEAEGAFKRALELDPNRVEVMVGLADALVKQGKGAEAKELAERAIERAPHWSTAHFTLGEALLEKGNSEGALAAYQRAIDLDPTQGEWMFGKIALAVNKGGANAAASQEATRAVQADTADPRRQKKLGDALMRGLRYEEALRAYQVALAADPAMPGVHPLMGLCYELSGRKQSAAASYEKGTEDPDEELRELARRRLARVRLFAAKVEERRAAAAPPAFGGIESAAGPGREKAVAELSSIEVLRPALAAGLRALPPLRDGEVSAGDAAALERISKLVQHARARDELRRGFALIEREVSKRAGPPTIDGRLGEWEPAERLGADPPGDAARGAPAGADLLEVSAAIHGEHVSLAWRAQGAARLAPDLSYWVHLYTPKRERPWIAVGICADDVYVVRFQPNGARDQTRGREATGVEFAAGPDGLEARIPLRWLSGARRLQAEAYSWSGTQKWDAAAQPQPPVRISDGWSPSLLALFNLARDVALEADDRPALAIALASGDYYAAGDEALARAVEEDDRRMLRFARSVKVWQKATGQTPLDQLPLPALLFWANRSVQWRGLDVHDYRRDTIAPATLEAMFRYAQKRGWRGRAAGDIVEQAERHLIDPMRWQYTSSEMVTRGLRARAGENATLSESEKKELNKFVRDVHVDGRKLSTDGTFNPDLQFDYLLATDALLGHCGNLAQTVVDFARAAGVPATIVQGIEEQSKLYPNPHAFPIYYDGAAKAWRSFQGRKYRGIRSLTLYFFLPPLAPPEGARPTGGGSYWFPVHTTYDEAGPMFTNGFEAEFVREWIQALAASGR